jgi:hydrogenase maturation protease
LAEYRDPASEDLHKPEALKGIVIGLGNPIMSDDRTGLLVAEEVCRCLPDYELDTSMAGGFDVVDRILGYRRAVVIDSMVTGNSRIGTVRRIDRATPGGLLRISHSHGINFLEAIEIARECGADLPEELVIYGIEVKDPFSIGEGVSEEVESGLSEAVRAIVNEIGEMGPGDA